GDFLVGHSMMSARTALERVNRRRGKKFSGCRCSGLYSKPDLRQPAGERLGDVRSCAAMAWTRPERARSRVAHRRIWCAKNVDQYAVHVLGDVRLTVTNCSRLMPG